LLYDTEVVETTVSVHTSQSFVQYETRFFLTSFPPFFLDMRPAPNSIRNLRHMSKAGINCFHSQETKQAAAQSNTQSRTFAKRETRNIKTRHTQLLYFNHTQSQ